ncbi:aspartic proteinase CDR1-like [Nicotiana sylvestris]|uniref:aspartic proteinase CDR1-like n=1 Tax=Nicotiana sylvestris TaxID=4096 RepID=UPI00388CA4C0
MIHYEAVNSPFYNPELTLEDRVRIMNERSETRISHLITDLEKDGNKIQIYPAYTSQFLVPLKNGTPAIPQILTMDTGSLLLWVHCGFTIGGEGSPAPLYCYAESSSYVEDVYCGTSVCNLMILKGKCGVSTRRCEDTYSYATGKYYITLEKINVGDKFLDIDPIIFKRIDHQGGMIVDSGATSSYLPEIAYKKLKEEIKSVIGTTLEEFISNRPEELCYYGIVARDLKGLPTIAYHFSENAKMEFSADNLFRQDRVDHFCLSIQISESKKMPFSILGVWAQQYFYDSFDFNTMRMSFTRIDGDRLFD